MEVHLLQNEKIFKTTSTNATKKRKKDKAEPEGDIPLQKGLGVNWSELPDEEIGSQFLHPTPELTTFGGLKLGWIQGVLIPCLLNIWGVMLFLRIAWVVAQAGVALTVCIILLSGLVCVITTLSLSAICTNGELKGGGVYYLVSRSLGAELGGSVGLIFAFANAVAASMNTIGFCDSLNDLLKEHGVKIVDNSLNDTRIVGTVALIVMCIICAIGMDWETKTQNFLITVIVIAIFNFIIGAFIGPRNNTQIAQGFVGINAETMAQNMGSDFRYSENVHHNLFTVFAMYFPAVTGVQAGANICGDLKDPATAIPKGTMLALAISMLSYLAMALLSGAGALRDASGDARDLSRSALSSCTPNCTYGLHNSYQVMQLMSAWGPLIYGGCWAATLSTALTNLLSVPRLIQALGVDRIYPGLIFFSKPYGKHGEPYRGYVLTFFVSLIFLLIADLNTIAPLISNFYLASYALINYCTFHAAKVRHISWRPTFRFYNTWVSLAGAVLCGAIMVLMSWVMALVTVLAFLVLYLLVHYRKPDADWGSSTEAQRFRSTVAALVRMEQQHSAKAYTPQVLVLAGRPGARPALLALAAALTRGSYSLVADIVPDKLSRMHRTARCEAGSGWMYELRVRGFFALLDGHTLELGARALLQVSGLGRLAPNILLMGYKYDWGHAREESLVEYVGVIRLAFEHQVGIAVLRTTADQRAARPLSDSTSSRRTRSNTMLRSASDLRLHTTVLGVMHADSETAFGEPQDSVTLTSAMEKKWNASAPMQKNVSWQDIGRADITQQQSDEASKQEEPQEPKKNESEFLDAWWLYDDGGLNILVPYILAYRGARPLRMRIYALARTNHNLEDAKTDMEQLLSKFRIEYDSLRMLSGVDDAPAPGSWALLHDLIQRHRATDERSNESTVSEAELTRLRARTVRALRLRELLLEHSSAAHCVVMTLPVPRRGSVSAPLYMAWLELMSRDLPPMLFVRGNDTSVLTIEA